MLRDERGIPVLIFDEKAEVLSRYSAKLGERSEILAVDQTVPLTLVDQLPSLYDRLSMHMASVLTPEERDNVDALDTGLNDCTIVLNGALLKLWGVHPDISEAQTAIYMRNSFPLLVQTALNQALVEYSEANSTTPSRLLTEALTVTDDPRPSVKVQDVTRFSKSDMECPAFVGPRPADGKYSRLPQQLLNALIEIYAACGIFKAKDPALLHTYFTLPASQREGF